MFALQDSEDEKIAIRATENFADRQDPKVNKVDRSDESVIRFESDTLSKALAVFVQSLGLEPQALAGISQEAAVKLLEEKVDDNIPEPRKG